MTNKVNLYMIQKMVAPTDWEDSNPPEPLDRFTNFFYPDLYCDSYDQKTPLQGYCHCVGYPITDEEGFEWRSFTDENWDKVKDLSNEEIYKRYPAAPAIDHSCRVFRIYLRDGNQKMFGASDILEICKLFEDDIEAYTPADIIKIEEV